MGAEEGVVGHVVPALEAESTMLADLRHAAAELGAVFLEQPLLGDRAGRDHGAVRRADERPPPRGSRTPYFFQ